MPIPTLARDRSIASSRILYLALADARGHLMRAHILRGLLAANDVTVEIVTTSREGKAFLDSLGTPSVVLSEHFRVVIEGNHDLSRDKTDRCIRDYYLDPRRALRDVARLRELAHGADLVVDDSLHPALLLAPLLPGNRMRVVHLFGENIWQAAEQNFAGRNAPVIEAVYPHALHRMRDAAFACVMLTHSLRASSGNLHIVPPIIGAPLRDAPTVRSALGAAPGERLAAVYLNPHFTAPRVATAIEQALRAEDYRMAAVGEGYADRPGWAASDADFASVVAAADLYLSGAGMGALAQSRAFGTPLVGLLGGQPEQTANAREAENTQGAFATVMLGAPDLRAALQTAIVRLRSSRGTRTPVETIHEQWIRVFFDLIDRARKETNNEHAFSRPRNEQSQRQRSQLVDGVRRIGPPLRAPTEAIVAAPSIDGARRHA